MNFDDYYKLVTDHKFIGEDIIFEIIRENKLYEPYIENILTLSGLCGEGLFICKQAIIEYNKKFLNRDIGRKFLFLKKTKKNSKELG